MWLNIKSEYSFGYVYGHLEEIVKSISGKHSFIGLSDLYGTWGHVKFTKLCEKYNVKPIYGVILPVTKDLSLKEKKFPRTEMVFIAKNFEGLKEIYALTSKANSREQFYYIPRLSFAQINNISNNVYILSGISPDWLDISREVFQQFSPDLPHGSREIIKKPVACIDNYYPKATDYIYFDSITDKLKHENKTSPQHILSYDEWLTEFPGMEEAIQNMIDIAEDCNTTIIKSKPLKFPEEKNIEEICRSNALKIGINLEDPVYKERFEREINLIEEKGFTDYFLIVADLIEYAKKHMVVGPARGSSAGSLVCYLMNITEIDPIPYNLLFERFIDVNRSDLPDIDIDFQDNKRNLVMRYLKKKYGSLNVCQLGNIMKLKPRSAIIKFSKSMGIHESEIKEIKDIIDNDSNDESIKDVLENTKKGKEFLDKFPEMEIVKKAENHCDHTSVHAAGIIVSNDNVSDYCSMNKENVGMIDKRDVEFLNLLKIDALGLVTLTIFADVCEQIGKSQNWLYEIPLNDEKTFDILNKKRFIGLFQFDGWTAQKYASEIIFEDIEDISAIFAIARPGPIEAGSANKYVLYKNTGMKGYISQSEEYIEATKDTLGVIIYQEQIMGICRNYAGLDWGDIGDIRKGFSKSLGEKYLNKYKEKFIEGSIKLGHEKNEAVLIWDHMVTFGGYGFNKSHSLVYSVIAYISAYLKAYYPLEFTLAYLNNTKNELKCLKLLRDVYENDGVKYVPYDKDISTEKWTNHNGVLYGSLQTIHGIGYKKAKEIVRKRSKEEGLTPGLEKLLDQKETFFTYLYPATQKYGHFYRTPEKYGIFDTKVSLISEIQNQGEYVFLGLLVDMKIKNANDPIYVKKRGGKEVEGPTTYLTLRFEDDTDSIMGNIGRMEYESIGKDLAENGKIEKDWYVIHAEMRGDWRFLTILNIVKIGEEHDDCGS